MPDSGSSAGPWELTDQLSYWSDGSVDRYEFLQSLLARLKAEGWQYKTDTGWSNYDVEIFGNRWTRLRLTTVGENLHQGKRNLHCRLEAGWSLQAKLMFWGLLGVELIALGLFAAKQPYSWLLLLTLASFHFFLEQQCRNMERTIAKSLDLTAAQNLLIKLPRSTPGRSQAGISLEFTRENVP